MQHALLAVLPFNSSNRHLPQELTTQVIIRWISVWMGLVCPPNLGRRGISSFIGFC